MVDLKRIYEPYSKTDGYRILVDRLWPRGISKEKAHLDLWIKEIAPSTSLRKWFGHDPKKWEEFEKKYKTELRDKMDLVQRVKDLKKNHTHITLLYGARDTEHNEAIVLQNMLS